MSNTKKKYDIWTVITVVVFILYLVFFLYPIFELFKQAVIDTETGKFTLQNFELFFSKNYYFNTIINSFKVTIVATIATLIVGIPLAYLMSVYRVKGKSFLQIIIILCSMSAPFIGAYSWVLLLGRSGIITKFVKSVFGFQMPSIYGFWGIVLVLTLQLFPLVFLYIQGALKNVDNTLFEASESMGCTGIKRFFTIVLPLIKPTVLASALLVFMRAFADFGTPMLIGEGYQTFPRLIYDQFMSEVGGNTGFAAAMSIIAILVTTVFFLVQRYLSNRNQFSMSALHPIEPAKAKGIKGFLVHLFAYGVVAFAYMPQLYVVYTSFKNTSGLIFVEGYSLNSYRQAFDKLGNTIQNTFLIPGISLVIVILLSILVAYVAVRRRNPLTATVDTVSMIPYIIPGQVMGIALLAAFSKKPIVIAGTMTIMIVAMVIRRSPYTIRSSAATLSQISPSIEEASISLGASNMKTFFKVTAPMMAPGIISGAILSWITMISELSTSIILYNGRTQTMTVSIYTQVIRGNYGIAAALATILSVLTLIALMVFMKFSKTKDVTI